MAESTNRKDEVMSRLTDGIARLVTSERWHEWLKVASKFHHYSFNNQLLIQLQCPTSTRVAGFHAWRNVGRNVRKGEKGLWILAPMTRKVRDDGALGDENVRVITGFKPVPVFDISQTDGEELPEVCERLDGEDLNGVYARLLGVAHSIGFTVEDATFSDSRNGDCSHSDRRIRIATDRSPIQRAKTLAHELAHSRMHEKFNNRALAELEAESVAFIVMSTLEVDSSDYSLGYVSVWAGGGDEAIAAIKSAGNRIQRTADDIVSRLDVEASEAVA